MTRDFGDFLTGLGTEKFRASIIYDKSPFALIEFAGKASSKFKGKHIDFIELFNESSELLENVDTFDIEKLKSFMIEGSAESQLLLITRMDFLLDSWSQDSVKSFYRLVKNQWKSFIKNMKATPVFYLLTNNDLLDQRITDSSGNSRILPLSAFKDID